MSVDKCIHPDCECLDYCEAQDMFSETPKRIADLEEQIAYLKDREILVAEFIEKARKEAYNAGLERAAKIADSGTWPIMGSCGNAIRKEIEK